ncbi:MAG: hypothetical protein ACLQHK_10000 [Gallionellaceae bacterium]
MSIRASLHQVLHVAPPIGMQHATNLPDTATSHVTLSARTYGKASADTDMCATSYATVAQQSLESDATLAADYEELTAGIIKVCQLAGYPDEVRDRMLVAGRNLYPFRIATEAAYFRLQVLRSAQGLVYTGKKRADDLRINQTFMWRKL